MLQLSHHTGGECPRAQVQCPYQPMGCDVMVTIHFLFLNEDSNTPVSNSGSFCENRRSDYMYVSLRKTQEIKDGKQNNSR